MEQWYYKVNDEKCGPFSQEELKAEMITKQTLVRNENMPNWEEAGNIEGLKAILAETPAIITKNKDTANTAKPDLLSFFLNRINYSFVIIAFYIAWIACTLGGISKNWTNLIDVLQTITTIYLLYGLKKYLNELDQHSKSDYIIYCSIIILLISGIIIFFPDNISGTLSLVFLIISVTLSLLFMVNLIKIKNDYSDYIKSYGYFQFFCRLGTILFFLLALAALADEKLSIGVRLLLYQAGLIASVITRIMPFIVLALVFIKTRNRLKLDA